ncbi:hypothetical protein DOTSEDRAFT_23966 [Dothistroma septosporum NZE10]|uniref:Uncharacterized protein n=1 Tax=Dothistroma septosporum (strain NZE10 / CBS 128990) TaxID=675120 RepID=N1PJZ7_DOTSN|nr:hypothetical protein DOTSEDRAFT_23966 [Dothistroma septosporum NZE10]
MAQRVSPDRELGFQKGDVLKAVFEFLTAKESATLPSGAGKRAQQVKQSHLRLHDLVSTFKTNLISDEPSLNFDYLGFWSALFELHVDMMNAMGNGIPLAPRRRFKNLQWPGTS